MNWSDLGLELILIQVPVVTISFFRVYVFFEMWKARLDGREK